MAQSKDKPVDPNVPVVSAPDNVAIAPDAPLVDAPIDPNAQPIPPAHPDLAEGVYLVNGKLVNAHGQLVSVNGVRVHEDGTPLSSEELAIEVTSV